MKKNLFIYLLLIISTVVALACYLITCYTVTFIYVNPYTETAGMKGISKTIYELEKSLNKARLLASAAGYKFDYVYTNAYGSGFLKDNPIPNDLDYEIMIDLGTFDYNEKKTKEDIANEIISKIDAFHYYLISYFDMSDNKMFYTMSSAIGGLNVLDMKHEKFQDEIATSLDDAIKNTKYVNHLTKVSKRTGEYVYYMPYVMEPGRMLLKDYPLLMVYSDMVSYYDYMRKYMRIVSLSLTFCAKINHDGKTTYIEIIPELASTGPLDLSLRLYAPNVFFRNSASKYLKNLYSIANGDKYLEMLIYCFADHLKVIYPDDAFEFNPIKIFKRTLQIADMIEPVIGKEESENIHKFIGENLNNRDIQLLNEYINIADIIGRTFKSGKLYESFVQAGKMKVLVKELDSVIEELRARKNIDEKTLAVLDDFFIHNILDMAKVNSLEELMTQQTLVGDKKFRKVVTPEISRAVLNLVSDREKMEGYIQELKDVFDNAGYKFVYLYVAGPDTFIMEKNEFTSGIKDFKDFAEKNDLADDMKFVVMPKDQIPRDYTRYQIWVRYNTTPEQDAYYQNMKKVLLDNKSEFKEQRKTFFVK